MKQKATAKHPRKPKGDSKQKRRKKAPGTEEGVRAALLAAALVVITILFTISLLVYKQQNSRTTPELVQRETPSPVIQEPRKVPSGEEEAAPSIPAPETTPQNAPSPAKSIEPGLTESPARIPEYPVDSAGVVSLVIDDAGNNLHELEPFLAFPGPLTIAVLPGLPYSAEAARRIREAGKECILHQPMEALGGENPGPGAIYGGMQKEEIWEILETNLEEIGPVQGMNNHQGSMITMDEAAMETILAFCEYNGIYFLDSRTTAESVVPAVAARMGIQIRERDVFVDNIQEKAVMIRYIQEGMRKAEKQGAAVMIGHVWSSELASTLNELYPELVEQGFTLSTISKLMMGTYEIEDSWD